jgi:hypothetical protein
MSGTTFHLDCCWGARCESDIVCAGRLASMLAGLAALNPTFARWFNQGRSRAEADDPFCTMSPRVDELIEILQRNEFSPGFPKDGFSIGAWNGEDSARGVALSIHVGRDWGAPVFSNTISLHFLPIDATNADIINANLLRPALLACAAAWNPDWAGINPWGYFERWKRAEPWDDDDKKPPRIAGYVPPISAGWMTYLCADYARCIRRPQGIEVEPVAGGGALLIATREVFTPGNPAHDAAADAIQDALLPLQNLPCEARRR